MISEKRRNLLKAAIILKMISWWLPGILQSGILPAKDHIQGTTDVALAIFDSIRKIHGMEARQRLLLADRSSAARLRKVYQHGRCGRMFV